MKKMMILVTAFMASIAITACKAEIKYDEKIETKGDTLVAFRLERPHLYFYEFVLKKEEKKEVAQYN